VHNDCTYTDRRTNSVILESAVTNSLFTAFSASDHVLSSSRLVSSRPILKYK